MKRFTVPCDFNGVKYPFHVYVGEPHPKRHPLHFQSQWLSNVRGGNIPQEVMDSFERLHKIAIENNVSFEDLCVYALGENAKAATPTATPAPAEDQATPPPEDPSPPPEDSSPPQPPDVP